MPKPQITFGTRHVGADQADAFGVSPSLKVDEIWIEHWLDGTQWVVAARVMPDANGNAVIGELRVFPHEPDRPPGFTGQWSATALGLAAPVPRGGLPGTLLHRTIRVSQYEPLMRRTFGIISQLGGLPPSSPARQTAEFLKTHGFVAKPVELFPSETPLRRARGRQPVSARDYARLAHDYVAATKNPIATLAKRWKQSPAWVTSRIARARRQGFLTKAVKPGVRGGQLTEKAKAALVVRSAHSRSSSKKRLRAR